MTQVLDFVFNGNRYGKRPGFKSNSGKIIFGKGHAIAPIQQIVNFNENRQFVIIGGSKIKGGRYCPQMEGAER